MDAIQNEISQNEDEAIKAILHEKISKAWGLQTKLPNDKNDMLLEIINFADAKQRKEWIEYLNNNFILSNESMQKFFWMMLFPIANMKNSLEAVSASKEVYIENMSSITKHHVGILLSEYENFQARFEQVLSQNLGDFEKAMNDVQKSVTDTKYIMSDVTDMLDEFKDIVKRKERNLDNEYNVLAKKVELGIIQNIDKTIISQALKIAQRWTSIAGMILISSSVAGGLIAGVGIVKFLFHWI